jgi:hypothetical protein
VIPWIAWTRVAGRDRDAGVDQGREFLHHGAVFKGDGADLDDPVTVARRKARRFEIDDDVAAAGRRRLFHVSSDENHPHPQDRESPDDEGQGC